ncbi:hypothetical protein AN651_16865 [Xanthomonas arboricola]|nr:hypothetical protein AN651_16865 [Xanthomonas arboricola]
MCVFQAALSAGLHPLEERAEESIRNDVAGNRVDHDRHDQHAQPAPLQTGAQNRTAAMRLHELRGQDQH